MPRDHARSLRNSARSSRAAMVGRSSGRLPSVARRRGCAPASLPPSLRLRSTFPACRPPTEASESAYAGKVMNSPISDRPFSDFPITDCIIASHPARCRDSAMKPCLIVWRRRSLQDTTGRSLCARASVPPRPARRRRGVLPLGFHRGKSVCSNGDLIGTPQFCAVVSSQFLVK